MSAHHQNPALTMDAYRNALFRQSVAKRLREGRVAGQLPAQVVASIAAEQQALAAAITMPEFVKMAGDALHVAQQQQSGNARYVSRSEETEESMRQIMRRRAAEAVSFAHQVVVPRFYEPLLENPALADAPVEPSLEAVKTHETLEELLHRDEKGAPQVIAHIDASAKGTMLEHDALAVVFASEGPLQQALVDMLARQLPEAPHTHLATLAAEWLRARHSAAKLSADLCAPEGAAYREAVRISKEWHERPTPVVSQVSQVSEARQMPQTPTQAEAGKSREQRAEDVAYTLNHALSCGTTDVLIAPTISALSGLQVGCMDPTHNHPHPPAAGKGKLNWKLYRSEVGHYLKGEVIGDVAAVPLTIAVQRLFPNFMEGLRRLVEPIAAPFFRRGAERAANRWADKHGLAREDAQVSARAEGMYRNEIDHLPQAVVWNMFAFPIGVLGQKWTGHDAAWSRIFRNKTIGAAISNGILLGGRALLPDAAEKWDKMNSEHVIVPATKAVGSLFGVRSEDVERMKKRHEEAEKPWRERVTADEAPQPDAPVTTR